MKLDTDNTSGDLPLFKTTVVLWTDFDPSDLLEIEALADLVDDDSAFVSTIFTSQVETPESDPQWVDTDFFDENTDETDDDDEIDLVTLYEEASGNSVVDDIVIVDGKGKYIGLFTVDMAMEYCGLSTEDEDEE